MFGCQQHQWIGYFCMNMFWPKDHDSIWEDVMESGFIATII